MKLETSLQELNTLLLYKNPETFTATWIVKHSPKTYRLIVKQARTPLNDIDWDLVTSYLDKPLQKRFRRHRKKLVKLYENQSEVDSVLDVYRDKLYIFISPQDKNDRLLRNKIFIMLVRVAQRGNVLAENELIEWVQYITNEWTERYPQIWKWRGRSDEVAGKIKACIRCYKYTGSFLGYLFKTLEYSARGLPYEVSLDDTVGDGRSTKIDFINFNEESREATLFGR